MVVLGVVYVLIKDFADKYQVQTDTIRYYEKEGILEPKRQANGYREYDEECEKQIQFIIVLKQLGFTLKEIQQLLILKGKPISTDCNNSTVVLVEQKIKKLEDNIQLYQQALKVLIRVKELINEDRYLENKTDIEELMLDLFNNIHLRSTI